MDELREWMENPQPAYCRGGFSSGRGFSRNSAINDVEKKEEHRKTVLLTGTDYAREIKDRETAIYAKNEYERGESSQAPSQYGLNSMEMLSSIGLSQCNINKETEQLTEEAMSAVYNKYSFQIKENTNNLAINDYKEKILNHIDTYPVVSIEGPTGCGKTTQVPQWILDHRYAERKHCKIVVTQPRRIAAISIAKRVAQERGWDVGGPVGYQVGLDNKTTNDTCIQYVTTGVLLQKLVSAKTMNEYTHVILDEVHERGQEMDFLLLVVKKFLYTVSPTVKVVLMSATFNSEVFAEYFGLPTLHIHGREGSQSSICLKIDKKQMFTVKSFFLNNLTKFGPMMSPQAKPKREKPGIDPEMHHLVIKLLNAFERIDKQEDNYTDPSEVDIASVLIFLPGINEIEELYGYLTDTKLRKELEGEECAAHKWSVLPLHSTITVDEQVRVFHRAPPGHRKIILSTNIAESSITVPDIKYVIDYCLMKILVADPTTNFTSLQLCWASKTNCEQRAGRAGRVRDGRVYRLVNDNFYEEFDQDCPPEIRRCPLERLVLLAKMLDMGSPSEVLALAMEPPELSNIHRTTLVLKEIGALKTTLNGEMSLLDGDITYLGRVMAKLPLDVKVSKLIMLGHIYGCLEETIIMAAAMSVKNIFSSPFRERLNAYNSKLTWADGSTSDCIAFLNVYKVWNHLRHQQYFKQQGSDKGNNEQAWGRRFYVQIRALRELDDLTREIKSRLSREGIEALQGKSPWSKNELPLILKVIIAGAFYPHYFIQAGGTEGREREAVKMLNGNDPRTTVYLKDFPRDQPGHLYASSIKRMVHHLIGDEPRVSFDGVSMKVYLTFEDSSRTSGRRDMANKGNPTIPGKVVLPVYKALKAHQLRMDIRLPLMNPADAKEIATTMEQNKLNINKELLVPKLPEIDDSHFPLKISQFINCGRFFVQYDDECTASNLRQIQTALNSRPLLAYTGPAHPGDVHAAPYQDATGTYMYRVRILKTLPNDMCWVFYFDYGSYGRVSTSSLRLFPSGDAGRLCHSLPPLCMECVLAELMPSSLLESHEQWTPAAERYFQDTLKKGRLLAKVYSVVRGVIAIELLAESGRVSINKGLVERGFARPSEESYESKMNHDIREMAPMLNLVQKRAYNAQQVEEAYHELRDLASPSAAQCAHSVHLKGPFSPLETSVHSLMYASRYKSAGIEWDSVNAVLLDTDPQEVYTRLLVAGSVGTNEASSKTSLRHTTLMPNIPGLPAIIALLFCPNTELRRDSAATRYVSALCGLGCSDDGAPLFPEHDLLVDIDIDLSVEDIGTINHIRHLMDFMMFCGDGQDSPNAEDPFRPQIPTIIREGLMSLLSKRRKHRSAVTVARAWEWNSAPTDELLELTEPSLLLRVVVYPLHAPLELRPRSPDHLRALKALNDQLHAEIQGTPLSSSKDELVCKLCGSDPMTVREMRIHLYSRAHRDKEEDFRMFDS